MKGFTLFSGIEGVGCGMKAAGIEHVGGIEYDDKIASVARDNGFDVTTADVLTADLDDFPDMDLMHASPPCPNFSNAKTDAQETAADIALAQAVANWIVAKRPVYFTLENVYQYRNSKSWETIARALLTHGYSLNYWHCNLADWGVPQTRQRMIVIARRDGIRPMLPPATHAENPQAGLFGTLRPWVGWYEAIEDLIPMLPDSQFAKWQLERLPEELASFLMEKDKGDYSINHRFVADPAQTVTSSDMGRRRAFIVNGNNAGNEWGKFYRDGDEPNWAVAASSDRGATRAFIASQGKYNDDMPVYPADAPHGTITANSNQAGIKGYVSGRIVQMTPRALARFQSFPDWYKLPQNKALACKGIGNAVPPLFIQRVAESLL